MKHHQQQSRPEKFSQFLLKGELLKAISELGFEKPTPIQDKVIPHLLSSEQDLIASAQTGTGKTAAFGLPLLNLIDETDRGTQAIILCPTRELCIQIAGDLGKYSKYIPAIKIVAVYGGARIDVQMRALKKGAQIVIGTPGRTRDMLKRGKLRLDNVRRVVLDEADEMLSMGFKEDLEAILSQTQESRQTLLFSATMSRRVVALTDMYMNNPLEIAVARINLAAANVKHVFYLVQARDRYETVKRIADINPDIYCIVFCRTRKETQEVANRLMTDNYNADTLHGDLSQTQRDEVMDRFRRRQIQLLVATDVAARGLDVDDLTHVINYNLPDDDEIYIHRSGRTGRAGKKGISIAIAHSRETRKIRDIEQKAGISFSKELVPTGLDICQKRLFALINKIENIEVNEAQIGPFLPAIQEKLAWLDREQLIKHFVSAEFNRYLSYYENAPDINLTGHPKDFKKGRRGTASRPSRGFKRFYVNLGFKHKINPAKLIGLVNECLRSNEAPIGHIEILKNFSFIEVDASFAAQLIEAGHKKKYAGVKVVIDPAADKPEHSKNPRKKKYKKKYRSRKKR